VFRFSTSGGAASFALNVAQFGANLDGVLQLLSSTGQILVTANPTNSFGATIARTLSAGTYYLVARSSGGYGNVGTYTLTGSVPGASQTPEIAVDVGGTNLADGGTLSFGTTTTGTPVTRTVTIRNTGAGTLNLGTIGALPAGFTLVSNIGAASLAGGQSTSFTVRLDAAATGSFSGGISFTNSDSDEGTFNISLSGSVGATPAAPVVRIIDNGASGFSTTGSWYRRTNLGRERDMHYALRGNGSAVATWTFTGLEAGQYRVSGTWPGSILHATNAPFSVYDGTQLLGTVAVNQERATSAFLDAGSRWQNLGTFTIDGSTLVVKLTNAANDRVVADGIRIERVYSTSAGVVGRGAPTATELVWPGAGETTSASPAAQSHEPESNALGRTYGFSAAGWHTQFVVSQAVARQLSSREEIFSRLEDLRPQEKALDEVIELFEGLTSL
jgi:hypothetical protein